MNKKQIVFLIIRLIGMSMIQFGLFPVLGPWAGLVSLGVYFITLKEKY